MNGILNVGPAIEPFCMMYETVRKCQKLRAEPLCRSRRTYSGHRQPR